MRERAYASDESARALAAFRAARALTMEMISGLTDAQFARTAVFEGYGPLTLRSLIHSCAAMTSSTWPGCSGCWARAEASRVG